MKTTKKLHEIGQSLWLDNITRRTEKREKSVAVVEIVAVKALWNYSKPQLSIRCPQRIQSKAVNFTRFQQI
jgi:hypothetical protein